MDLPEFNSLGPCQVSFSLANEQNLACEEVVRVVPGKRIVCRGQWRNQEVYAKIFIGPQAQRYAGRDKRGMLALASASIPSPNLLYAGHSLEGQAEVLIYASVSDSVNAEQLWDALPIHSAERFELAKKIVTAVAVHHNAGLLQTDLYLKNFLVQGEQVFTLDGDAIRRIPRIFSQRAALNNLALLLSKFDVEDESEWLSLLLAVYAVTRKDAYVLNVSDMQKRIATIRHRVSRKYADKKVFRECTEVKVAHSLSAFFAVSRAYFSTQLDVALNEPDRLLDADHYPRLKDGNTCTVGLTEIDSRKVVIKRYNIKSFWHGLGRAFRQSRAAISWANAHRLQMHEIATASPIALIERRFGPIRRQAFFLAEYVDAKDVQEFFADSLIEQEQKQAVALNIARLFRKLYLLNISHGDFKASNVKVVGTQPLLIDLDSMQEHSCRWCFERHHVRDLRRFLQNWAQDKETRNLLAQAFGKFYKDPRPLQQAGWL